MCVACSFGLVSVLLILSVYMDVGVLVSGCGCSHLPRTSFHFEVRMKLGTRLKTSVGEGIDVCMCVWVFAFFFRSQI